MSDGIRDYGGETNTARENRARVKKEPYQLPLTYNRDGTPILYTSAIIRKGDQFLLLHHIKRNVWLFPGGKPEPNETCLDCVIRECKEELGIALRNVTYHRTFFKMLDNIEHVGIFYNVGIWEGAPEIKEPHKHDGLRWMLFEEMQKEIVSQPEMGIAQWVRDARYVLEYPDSK